MVDLVIALLIIGNFAFGVVVGKQIGWLDGWRDHERCLRPNDGSDQ